MIYKFTPENNEQGLNLEIENPTIEVIGLADGNPDLVMPLDFINNRYNINIKLITPSVRVILTLRNVQAESMDMASQGADIPSQVLTALNEQFAI